MIILSYAKVENLKVEFKREKKLPSRACLLGFKQGLEEKNY